MQEDGPSGQRRQTRLWLLTTITVILTGWALRATGPFMVPVIFSIFLALLVMPLDQYVAAKAPPKFRWLGHVAAMGAILAALLVFVGLIWVAAQQVVEQFNLPGGSAPLLPQFGDGMSGGEGGSARNETVGSAAGIAPGAADIPDGAGPPSEETASAFRALVDRYGRVFSGAGGLLAGHIGDWASNIATQILSAAGATLSAVVLVFFLTLIMLLEGPAWREKLGSVLDASARGKAMDSLSLIGDRLRRYLLARTILGVMTAFLYGAWLWIFDLNLLVVWVLLAFLLNFIPTFGSLIAGILPVIYAFLQKDVGAAVAIAAGIFVIEQVMGNYVDPRVQGRQVSLSSLVVLIALLVWGWIWGIAGAILAVPITISAMIICAHIGPLRPFALMLSNVSDMKGLDRQAKGSPTGS